jgi:hypothetical protein
MSEDECQVRERLKQHLRERLKWLKEQHERRTPEANAGHGEMTKVAPDLVVPLRNSQED